MDERTKGTMTFFLKFEPTKDDGRTDERTNGRTDERTKVTMIFFLKFEPTKDDGRTDENRNSDFHLKS